MDACKHINDLSSYLDGELDARRRLAMEAHLDGCAACRAELEQLRALSGVLAEVPQPVLPPHAMWRLHGRVNEWLEEAAIAERETERVERRILRITRILTGIAACVLVAGSLWVVHGRQSASPSRLSMSKRTIEPWEQSALTGNVTGVNNVSTVGGENASAGDMSMELLDGGLVNPAAGTAEAAEPTGPGNEGAE